jgi:hypothetical protein
MFYLQYEVRPLPGNTYWLEAGGAFANCYIYADAEAEAVKQVQSAFLENCWEVVALEEGPLVTTREQYLEDPDTLECFDEALENGECYVFHLWPLEPQDGDAVH